MKLVGVHIQKGFTLIEALIAIIIIAILAAFVVPSIVNVVSQHEVEKEARAIANTLNLARSEAIVKGKPVFVCPITVNSATLTTTNCKLASTAPDWSDGILAYTTVADNPSVAEYQAYGANGSIGRQVFLNKNIDVYGEARNLQGGKVDNVKTPLVFNANGSYGYAGMSGRNYAFIIKKKGTPFATTNKTCAVVLLDASGKASYCDPTTENSGCTCEQAT